MIVGEFYDGDHDNEVAWKQHDVYHKALGILIKTCNRLAQFAKMLLEDRSHEDWGKISTCDHRTLQGAHDLLAAAWRFRHDLRQGSLPLYGETRAVDLEILWLDWLREEVAYWTERPELVRDVQLILANQNDPVGYAAESRLCIGILDRFPDVSWKPKWRAAYMQDLAKDIWCERGSEASAASAPATPMTCECTAKGSTACNQIPCKTTIARAAREGWVHSNDKKAR